MVGFPRGALNDAGVMKDVIPVALIATDGTAITGLPVTIADGADVAQGAIAATAYSDATGAASGTLVGLLKGFYVSLVAMSAKLPASLGIKTAAASLSVAPASDGVFGVKASSYTQLGYQQILSATLATSQQLAVPQGATVATIQNNSTGVCRWRPDGSTTAPTASIGQTIAAGATLTLDDGEAGLNAARFIIGSGTVILDICYFA